ncbi:CarD family transcriptional regulator [Roseococcus sp. SDR]|uniref:CarD family transcriptional regulator n=1 Tax=Roseococcus sp. SDR TaxID=2835532 RepID=UPI00352FF524
MTKSKASEAKSTPKSAPTKTAPAKAEKPAATAEAPPPAPAPTTAPAPEPTPAPAGPRPSIVVAAPPNMPVRPTTNPMSPRPPMGRPNMPPSFAVRSPGRPGFAEGQSTPPRPPGPKVEFKAGDHVVYPTHGVGTVQGIEVIEVAGMDHHMIVVTFEENRMTLRVPVNKVPTAGLRKLFTQKEFEAAIDTLKGRARIKRTMWSRRAQEYEAKINSGDPIQIAEVVRDLQRNAGQPDQSFSERQIYEQALERLAAEYAAIEKIDKLAASEALVAFAKSS